MKSRILLESRCLVGCRTRQQWPWRRKRWQYEAPRNQDAFSTATNRILIGCKACWVSLEFAIPFRPRNPTTDRKKDEPIPMGRVTESKESVVICVTQVGNRWPLLAVREFWYQSVRVRSTKDLKTTLCRRSRFLGLAFPRLAGPGPT